MKAIIHRVEHSTMKKSVGFTLVEMLIVIPIVMIVIGGLITTIVAMTGDILASRASDTLTYSIQDSFAQIQQDVEKSSGYLATNDFSVASPQGTNNGSAPFTNVGGDSPALILKMTATSGNPNLLTSTSIYLANQPNACASANIEQNQALSVNVVYFVKNNSLWRRVMAPSNYQTAGCSVPWQQTSCAPTISGTMCTGQDEDLLDADSLTLGLQYYDGAGTTTANATAVDTGSDANARNIALQTCDTIGVTLSANKQVSGRALSQSSSMRATRPTATIAAPTVPGSNSIPPAPIPTGSFAPDTGVTFTWQPVSLAATYTVSYKVNSGSWTNASTGTNATSYTLPDYVRSDTVSLQVVAVTAAGNSSTGTTSVTIPLWNPLNYQKLWVDYNQGYSSGAYAMTSSGLVVFTGIVQGATATAGDVIATVPPAYRPADTLMFPTSSNSAQGRVDVRPDGSVMFETGSPSWYSLNNISYMPTGTSFTALAMSNGWSNFTTAPYSAPFGYYQNADGRVSLKGIIKGGTLTEGTVIATIPAAIAPAGYEHIAVIDDNATKMLGIAGSVAVPSNSAYSIAAKGYSTAGFLGTQALYYASSHACTTLPLVASWVAYGTGYAQPCYTKGSDGIVTLSGLIKGGTVTQDTTIATLPAGYRPLHRLIETVVSNGAWARVDIDTSGNVQVVNVSATWLALDSISFTAEQ